MSLWAKSIDQIEYSDVEEFCLALNREGTRLDYKRQKPNDLADLLAAYANTVGGMVLFGIETDNLNQPKWPPPGMTNVPQLEESITSICQASIYPPIVPEVRFIEIPSTPTQVVGVVRIEHSPEAPHATRDRTRIYVRINSQKIPQEADIDTVEQMLLRRGRLVNKREELVAQSLSRMRAHLPHKDAFPVVWASVTPYFPIKPICTARNCLDAHIMTPDIPGSGRTAHTAPGGTFAKVLSPEFIPGAKIPPNSSLGLLMAGCTVFSIFGHVFSAQVVTRERSTGYDHEWIADVLNGVCRGVVEMKQRCAEQFPQWWEIMIGVENARDSWLTSGYVNPFWGGPPRFIDDRLQLSSTCRLEELESIAGTNARLINHSIIGEFLSSYGLTQNTQ